MYRLFAYFTKACVYKNHHIFHFFQTIASCDHQLTSEGQLVRPFSLLFAILPLSYDFGKWDYLQILYFMFCSEDRCSRLCTRVLSVYFPSIGQFQNVFRVFRSWGSRFTASGHIHFHMRVTIKCLQTGYFNDAFRCWSIIPCCVHDEMCMVYFIAIFAYVQNRCWCL